jgi:hypothetical protein
MRPWQLCLFPVWLSTPGDGPHGPRFQGWHRQHQQRSPQQWLFHLPAQCVVVICVVYAAAANGFGAEKNDREVIVCQVLTVASKDIESIAFACGCLLFCKFW